MAPTTTIEAPDAVSVPDGTPATAANMGIHAVATTGSPTLVWFTRSDGSRGVRVTSNSDNDSARFDIADQADVLDYDHWAYEFAGLSYDWSAASLGTDQLQIVSDMRIGGSSQCFLIHRYREAVGYSRIGGDDVRGAIECYVDLRGTFGTDGEEISLQRGKEMYSGVPARYGVHYNFADPGTICMYLNGFRVAEGIGFDGTVVDSADTAFHAQRYETRDRAGEVTEIIFPIKLWEDVDPRDDIFPDRSDASLGPDRLTLQDTRLDGRGVWEKTSGSLDVVLESVASGGTNPWMKEFVTSGSGSAVVELRADHALGDLPNHAPGKTLVCAGYFYAPSGTSVKAHFGDAADADVFGVELDGSSGSAGAREIQRYVTPSVSTATGMTYDESRWYALWVMLDSDETTTSLMALLDQFEADNSDRRLYDEALVVTVDPTVTINKIRLEFEGAGIRYRPPFVFEKAGVGLYSSWFGGDSIQSPIAQVPNNAGGYLHRFPSPALDAESQLPFYAPHTLSDGGRATTDFLATLGGDFTPLRALEGVVLFSGDGGVNDISRGRTAQQIADDHIAIIDAALEYRCEYWYVEIPKIPDFTSGEADIADAADALVRAYMEENGHSDLLTYCSMPENATQAEFAAYYGTGDGTHLDAGGNWLWIREAMRNRETLNAPGGLSVHRPSLCIGLGC
tara:strand:- start:7508 stop:9547 length:2040 start_codon:yes stop_codon:yes gene_type:complete